ncbi:hypothetical protein B0T17DRAFT_502542 [Bombardia bombarda]|uniref:Uncharacterized protein n=1 Tax=Bombardia bombarda TaxID=252184 RepID=A0AA39XJU9_9PEZI|nr:hypothetical protein B0T17DRAFT_502542 [Bombardia bombarda]
MAVLCCCTTPRSSKTRPSPSKEQPKLPTPPPPARLPGPLTLNPVQPPSADTSPKSMSTLQTAIPSAILPVEPVELGELVVEDSDSDEEPEPSTQSKSASTLQLVRTHIRRHLSQDSLPRRKSRSAVGTSQEEIERRAELKRLMHKRIQEELRSEEGQEAPQSEMSPNRHPSGPPGHPRPSADHLPGGGPRDNLEFSVLGEDSSRLDKQCTSIEDTDTSFYQSRLMSSDLQENDHPDGRRASCPERHSPNTGQSLLRERSSLPQMPKSPDLLPKRLSSTRDASSIGSSLRLSYSAGQLDEFLSQVGGGYIYTERPISTSPGQNTCPVQSQRLDLCGHSHSLSRSRSSPSRHGTPANDRSSILDQSPLGTWLRSQGIRSRSPSLSCARASEQTGDNDASVQEAEVVYLRRWSSVQNCAVPEAEISRPEVVHLYDMDIHRQLGTRAFNSEEQSLRHSESGRNTTRSGSRRHQHSAGSDAQPSEVEENVSENHGATMSTRNGVAAGVIRKSSSKYPSTTNIVAPSPGASSFYLPVASRKNSGFKWLDDAYNPHAPPKSEGNSGQTTGKTSSDARASPETYAQTGVTSPLTESENSVKPPRDTKPEIVEKTIGHFHLGHGAPATTIFKKFRKEVYPTPISFEPPKSSLLSKLHLTIPRRVKLAAKNFDGSCSDEQRVMPGNDPSTDTQEQSHSRASNKIRRSRYSPNLIQLSDCDNNTAELWQRAVREEARRRTRADPTSDVHHRTLSFPDDKLQKNKRADEGSSLRHYQSSPGTHSPARSHTKSTGPVADDMERSELSIERKAEARRLTQTPESWTRFPSYNRAERNRPTRHVDQVASKDFVSQSRPEQDISGCYTEEASGFSQQTLKNSPRSISGRFGRAVKSGLSRLIPSRGSAAGGSPKSPKDRQQSEDRGRANLEYPELELVPMGGAYKEVKALEQEIQNIKSSPQIQCPVPLRDMASNSHRVTLSAKMTTLLNTDGASENDHDIDDVEPMWTHIEPTTPANATKHGKESTTTTAEMYTTPQSAMSVSNDNSSSFHSYPQSRATPTTAGVVAKTATDADSVKSDSALVRNRRLEAMFRSMADSDVCTPAKFKTWSGRSKTHPSLAVDKGRLEQLAHNMGQAPVMKNLMSLREISGDDGGLVGSEKAVVEQVA